MALAGLAGLGLAGSPQGAEATTTPRPTRPIQASQPTSRRAPPKPRPSSISAPSFSSPSREGHPDAVDQGEPESEADVDFRETLEQFMQGVNANIDAGDFQAHYDLGIAFKEMGLLDEAIAPVPEGPPRSPTAGSAPAKPWERFFEKGRFAIAEAVLSRAIESLPEAGRREDRPDLLVGRALEAQGKDEPRCAATSAPSRSTSPSSTWVTGCSGSMRRRLE
jgi:tetratricopeptide (TPR) repeat protein